MESKEHKRHKGTSREKSGSKHDVFYYARKYIRRHWKVVPVRPKEKVPRWTDWQKERIKESEISDYFRQGDNIGILWGKPSHWAVDVDLDCDEAVALAPSFLPKTDRVYGRESRLTSHYVYESKDAETIKFNDPDRESSDPEGACLLELRSTGLQSIVPPSIHPNGERIRWEKRGEPVRVSPNELRIRLGQLASAALLARRWKKGFRNEIALALSGALLRAGWRKEKVTKFVEAIAIAADDTELERRVAAVEATLTKFANGEKVTGIPTLGEVLGEKTASSICKWLGIGKDIASVDQFEEADIFHTYKEFEEAQPISFAIENFLQNGCATTIAGLSGHGKTLEMLSIAKALLNSHKHKKLWHQFRVLETASRVLYLIPESGITPFKERLKRFHIYHYLEDGRLLVHTLSKGPTPDLSHPKMLAAAKDAYVFLDPTIRFEKGNENEAADNQRGLAHDIFLLLHAGARGIVAAHHSPKSFAKETVMTLENMLRGTGDIGAMVGTAFGIKQLNAEKNIIHIENLKARDFEPCGSFQIIGRPYINDEGDFRMYKKPGECGSLAEELKSYNKGGAPLAERNAKAERKRLLSGFLKDDPEATSPELVERFKQAEIELSEAAIRKYRREIRQDAKKGA